jgi:hypothetical protein
MVVPPGSLALLKKNLASKKVPRYMRVVEDVIYRPIGKTRASDNRTKSVSHFLAMHNGNLPRLSSTVSHLQVYIVRDLGKVSLFPITAIKFVLVLQTRSIGWLISCSLFYGLLASVFFFNAPQASGRLCHWWTGREISNF